MTDFRIYNTLTRKKEKFVPMDSPKVMMYVCGITPYGHAHLGHGRCYIVFDVLRRFLEYIGYKVEYVQNITDIDDKIINKSRETGEALKDIAEKYFNFFQYNMKMLNVAPADHYPKVSTSIGDIIDFISELIKVDKAYEINSNVYFKVSTMKNYGNLSGRNAEELVFSQEILSNDKEDPRDFALWKKDADYGWESPWGKGRPGWHIECSAMSRTLFGDQFDIHGGGLDLLFPHHENEIVQTEALTGKPPVNYWVHNGMVTLKGDKMAKSTGNFFLLKDLLDKFDPMALRMYLLSTGYRQKLDFTIENLMNTKKALEKLIEMKKELIDLCADDPEPYKFKNNDEVLLALYDDLNTARCIGEIFKKITPIKEKIFNGSQTEDDTAYAMGLIWFTEEILGISLHMDETGDITVIDKLIEKRKSLREEKKYAEADKIREELIRMGIEIKDTPSGTKWYKK